MVKVVDGHDVQLLANLYWKQKAAVRHNGEISEWVSIKQGVRQGCVASPHLFAMYTEMILGSFEDKGGFRIGGRVINNLRYADDTVILAETEHELQHMMETVVQDSDSIFRRTLLWYYAEGNTHRERTERIIPQHSQIVHHGVQQVIIHTYMSD